MKCNSLTIRLLSVIGLAFVVTTVSVLYMAGKQLSGIIDESQNALYQEKVEGMIGLLQRSNQRLEQTGMPEAYIKDFQGSSLKMLRDLHYRQGRGQRIYPFILTTAGVVVMHPVLEKGDLSLAHSEGLMASLQKKHSSGGEYYTYQGVENGVGSRTFLNGTGLLVMRFLWI